MTSLVTGLGPRNLSSSKAAARSDSYLSASLKSVVVALSRRAPMIRSEITTTTTQMPTTTNGLRGVTWEGAHSRRNACSCRMSQSGVSTLIRRKKMSIALVPALPKSDAGH